VQVQKDILSNLGLLLGRCPTKLVKVNLHPLVALLMDGVVLVAEFLASNTIRQGLGLGRSTVLVRASDIQSIHVPGTTVSIIEQK